MAAEREFHIRTERAETLHQIFKRIRARSVFSEFWDECQKVYARFLRFHRPCALVGEQVCTGGSNHWGQAFVWQLRQE
jgi:hypothetical protein